MPGIRTDDIVFIRALADSNLNMTRAAKNISYSYNAVAWHRKRINENTGLDPCNFYDMTKLLKMIEGR